MLMSIAISNVNYYIFTLLIILVICSNNGKISANSIYHQSLTLPNDPSNLLFERDHPAYPILNNDISSSYIWPRTQRSNYLSAIPNFDLRRGVIALIPYKKRTIPLELQKALYAHGIVGRRR